MPKPRVAAARCVQRMESLAWVIVLAAWAALLSVGLGLGDHLAHLLAVLQPRASLDARQLLHREDLGRGALAAEAG